MKKQLSLRSYSDRLKPKSQPCDFSQQSNGSPRFFKSDCSFGANSNQGSFSKNVPKQTPQI